MEKNKLAEAHAKKLYPDTKPFNENMFRQDSAKMSYICGYNAAESIANAKIQELEKELASLRAWKWSKDIYCTQLEKDYRRDKSWYESEIEKLELKVKELESK